ncbi:MAG: hypothetical protein MEQ07_11395 [Aquimonas sp.]|nr:hypothetical protein [Aquimonas sp.]
MPNTTLIFAALLILLGVGVFATWSSSNALLPATSALPWALSPASPCLSMVRVST